MKIPITQSEKWHKLQQDLNEKSFLETGKGYQYLAIIKNTPLCTYLYCPYGPIADSKEGFISAIESLEQLAKKHSAAFIRVEPFEEDQRKLLPKKAVKSKDLNPKETWLLDLKGGKEELLSKLPSRLHRYYKSAAKKGITIEKSKNPKDITKLLNLQQALAEKKGINTFSEAYLKTELKQPFATLYLVNYKDQETGKEELVAAGLVFDDDTTRYNLQGAQSELGRKLHATGILTIELILDAKEKGLELFDFWGIAPEDAPKDHPWAGFTTFKKTFDGYQMNHAGTYDIVLSPLKYKLYKSTRKINRLVR